MKAHPCKTPIPKKILDAAIAEATKQADKQINDITARRYNEFCIAMHQAGLSVKTIKRVQNILSDAVLPKTEEMRKTQDGDDWMRIYCEGNGIDYIVCEKRL